MVKINPPKDTVYFLAAIWAIYIVDFILPFVSFNSWGIIPRDVGGLIGIITSPFLHGSIFHILSNSLTFLGTSILIQLSIGAKGFRMVTVLTILLAGLGTWVFSSPGSVVVGASGLIYGYIGFLFGYAIFHPSVKNWLFFLITFLLYGGALFGLLKVSPFISWAGHFWGFVAGLAIAYHYKRLEEKERTEI